MKFIVQSEIVGSCWRSDDREKLTANPYLAIQQGHFLKHKWLRRPNVLRKNLRTGPCRLLLKSMEYLRMDFSH